MALFVSLVYSKVTTKPTILYAPFEWLLKSQLKLDSVEVYFMKVDVSIPTTFSIVVEFF